MAGVRPLEILIVCGLWIQRFLLIKVQSASETVYEAFTFSLNYSVCFQSSWPRS